MSYSMKKVTFIVRTCGRPQVLRQSIQSIKEQTYPNIEVVVVEDGRNISQQMLQEEYYDMNIKYFCTGERLGRSVVGNIALRMAEGDYFNFLDDDDLLYPKHTELLIKHLEDSGKKAAYSVAHEAPSVYCKRRNKFITLCKYVLFRQPFNRLYFTMSNYMPIQTVMFHRSLYEEYGGFRENLNALEDWDLWVRYAAHEDFAYVNSITSLYRVPFRRFKRDKVLFKAYEEVSKIFEEYEFHYNFRQCNEELNYILNEIRTPKWKKVIKNFLKKIYSQ